MCNKQEILDDAELDETTREEKRKFVMANKTLPGWTVLLSGNSRRLEYALSDDWECSGTEVDDIPSTRRLRQGL